LDRSSNRVATQGFATGRQESWSNTFGPGMTWQMTPRTSLSLGATYGILRFKGAGAQGAGATGTGGGIDSDTYGLQSSLGHVLTSRLTGTIGYGFTFLDLQREEDSTTHTPTLGFSYRLTPTLTGSASGGPAVTEIGGETFLSPSGTASLVQTLQFGTASVQYTRSVSAAGGLGGTTDTQTASGALTLPALWRGLLVVISPTYSIAESVGRRQTAQVDVRALTLNLSVTYQIARFASIFGGYTLLQQRTGGPSSGQLDVDQNRVRVGLQFGYPINFD
jgi:long-subunit fatty acid transport protein